MPSVPQQLQGLVSRLELLESRVAFALDKFDGLTVASIFDAAVPCSVPVQFQDAPHVASCVSLPAAVYDAFGHTLPTIMLHTLPASAPSCISTSLVAVEIQSVATDNFVQAASSSLVAPHDGQLPAVDGPGGGWSPSGVPPGATGGGWSPPPGRHL